MLKMDLDEWELLPSNGFTIDLHENGEKRNHHVNVSPSSNPNNSLIDMDYFQKFTDLPQRSNKICDSRVVSVLPIKFDHEIGDIPVEEKEILEDQTSKETISQVFFKKLKGKNEFVDMKMDSPKSINKGFVPQVDVGTYQFEERDGGFEEEEREKDSNLKEEEEEEEEVDWEDDNNGGLNVWKWAMNGFGALFSFGFAAVTVSLIVLGNRHKEKHSHKTQELHFQLYSHDKRMKQVVHHATKLNEAINAVRGAPLTRAHITIGGYYEGL